MGQPILLALVSRLALGPWPSALGLPRYGIGLEVHDVRCDHLPVTAEQDEAVNDSSNHLAIDLHGEPAFAVEVDLARTIGNSAWTSGENGKLRGG